MNDSEILTRCFLYEFFLTYLLVVSGLLHPETGFRCKWVLRKYREYRFDTRLYLFITGNKIRATFYNWLASITDGRG